MSHIKINIESKIENIKDLILRNIDGKYYVKIGDSFFTVEQIKEISNIIRLPSDEEYALSKSKCQESKTKFDQAKVEYEICKNNLIEYDCNIFRSKNLVVNLAVGYYNSLKCKLPMSEELGYFTNDIKEIEEKECTCGSKFTFKFIPVLSSNISNQDILKINNFDAIDTFMRCTC